MISNTTRSANSVVWPRLVIPHALTTNHAHAFACNRSLDAYRHCLHIRLLQQHLPGDAGFPIEGKL